ncbi:MAG: cytochrome c biogenesis CcdA family protein [Candidatus Dojkabacteria bacterium]|jgi:cytochrome c biogenesis protein CcdA
MKRIFIMLLLLILFLIPSVLQVSAQESTQPKFAVYFGGIGCPHCARVTPVLLKRVQEGEMIVMEYEIYKNLANSQALSGYADSYGLSLGVPQIMFDRELKYSGDTPILNNLDEMIQNAPQGEIFLADGKSVSFEDLNLSDLTRYPTFYSKDRIAIRKSLTKLTDEQNNQIKNFISSSTIKEAITDLNGKKSKTEKAEYSGGSLKFENALEVNGWLLQWNGESLEGGSSAVTNETTSSSTQGVSIGKTILLGLADSVNPCAISVLALMLIAIVTYNPGNRKQVLLAGLSFVLAVVIMYLFYGYLIITAFQFIQSLASIKLYIYKALGVGAIILGILELKDYFKYKPGGVGTEMPLFLRPKVNKIISKVTSPIGAFGMGLFVTVFLLPCTVGPYIILGGLLAEQGFINAIPMLLLYNLIFVLPMIAVTIIVFLGSKRAEDVKDWKEKNVRKMHLIAGALMLLIGVLMVFGVI